jgi:hypothetical protein
MFTNACLLQMFINQLHFDLILPFCEKETQIRVFFDFLTSHESDGKKLHLWKGNFIDRRIFIEIDQIYYSSCQK